MDGGGPAGGKVGGAPGGGGGAPPPAMLTWTFCMVPQESADHTQAALSTHSRRYFFIFIYKKTTHIPGRWTTDYFSGPCYECERQQGMADFLAHARQGPRRHSRAAPDDADIAIRLSLAY